MGDKTTLLSDSGEETEDVVTETEDDDIDHSEDCCPRLNRCKRAFTWELFFGGCLRAQARAEPDIVKVKEVYAQYRQLNEQDVEGLEGNVYRYLAFFTFGTLLTKDAGEEMILTPPNQCHHFCMMHLGVFAVLALQIFAPMALIATEVNELVTSYDFTAWRHYDWNQWMVVILGWLLLFLFILSNYFKIFNDARSSRVLEQMACDLNEIGEHVCVFWLIVDALVNCYVAVALSLSTFIVIYQSDSVVDVLLDALGLAFLNSADDIASDFGFLGGVWEDKRMGRLNVALRRVLHPEWMGQTSSSHPIREEMWRSYAGIPRCVYAVTKIALIACLIAAIPSPFFLASQATPGISESQEEAIRDIIT